MLRYIKMVMKDREDPAFISGLPQPAMDLKRLIIIGSMVVRGDTHRIYNIPTG
jgi:hypothetical protein